MAFFRFDHLSVGLSLGAAALLSSVAAANTGLGRQYRAPHYNRLALQLYVLELLVWVLGGSICRLRNWKNGQRLWNGRWQSLQTLGLADANASQNAFEPLNADYRHAQTRGATTATMASGYALHTMTKSGCETLQGWP